MAVNIHLRDIDHVAILASIEANEKKQDQVIFKTKDQQHYDIFKFAKKEGFTGIALRVVRYTREDKHEVVLPNPTNKQPAVVSEVKGGKTISLDDKNTDIHLRTTEKERRSISDKSKRSGKTK